MTAADDTPQPCPSGSGRPPGRGNGPTIGSESAPQPDGGIPSFGPFQLVQEIARSPIGDRTFKAVDKRLACFVALKILGERTLESHAAVQRLIANARAAATLSHANIVRLYDVGQHEGRNYVVMQYVEGQTLSQLAHGTALPAKQAARYVCSIAEAVAHAHECGLLHRELCPQNILIDEHDQPQVSGFGLATLYEEPESISMSGAIIGVPAYMSPEQVMGIPGVIGYTTDIYSLGTILYELLTGRRPFVGDSITEMLLRMLREEPASPRRVNPAVPRDLETICLKCLEKNPTRRYQTARALADDLAGFLHERPIRTPPITAIERTRRWCQRHPLTASLWAAVVVLIVGGAIGLLATGFKP
jgi:serine/threonine protein kinase